MISIHLIHVQMVQSSAADCARHVCQSNATQQLCGMCQSLCAHYAQCLATTHSRCVFWYAQSHKCVPPPETRTQNAEHTEMCVCSVCLLNYYVQSSTRPCALVAVVFAVTCVKRAQVCFACVLRSDAPNAAVLRSVCCLGVQTTCDTSAHSSLSRWVIVANARRK